MIGIAKMIGDSFVLQRRDADAGIKWGRGIKDNLKKIYILCFLLIIGLMSYVWIFEQFELPLLFVIEFLIFIELVVLPIVIYKMKKVDFDITFVLWIISFVLLMVNSFILLFAISFTAGNFRIG